MEIAHQAARGVTGKPMTIAKVRGAVLPLADGGRVLTTIHPSYLLRIQDERDKAAEYGRFVADLRRGAEYLRKAA